MVDEYTETGTSTTEKKGNAREVKEAMRSGTPEEVKESVKKIVEKGVSAVAGALKGVADTAEKEDVPGTAKNAVKQIGETTKELTKEGQKQFDTVKQEVQKNKPSTGGMGAGTMAPSGGIESITTPPPTTGITGSTSGIGTTGYGSTTTGTDLGSTTGTGTGIGSTGPESTREKDRMDLGTEENKLTGTKKERKSEF